MNRCPLPVIAKDCSGQAESVGRGACHVLHHLVLHLLQDQVQGLSWIYPKVAFAWYCSKSGDWPCFGSAWSLLYLITTSSFVAWIILATSTFVLPCSNHQIKILMILQKIIMQKITLTFVSLIPTSSSPDSRVPSFAAGVLSNTFKMLINMVQIMTISILMIMAAGVLSNTFNI